MRQQKSSSFDSALFHATSLVQSADSVLNSHGPSSSSLAYLRRQVQFSNIHFTTPLN
jgi:hypothetical protein